MAPLHARTGNILQSCLSFNFGLLASYRKTFRQADYCGRLQTIRPKRQVREQRFEIREKSANIER